VDIAPAVPLVEMTTVEDVRAKFVTAARQKGFEAQNLDGLMTCGLAEVLSLALRDIYYGILKRRLMDVHRTALVFAELRIDGEVLEQISQVLVNSVLKEITEVVSMHSLEKASLEDLEKLFGRVLLFGYCFGVLYVDQEFLQARIMTLRKGFIVNFHKEYLARLRKALDIEKWLRVPPQRVHLRIIRTLVMSDTTSLSLGGDAFDATPALLILLELTSGYRTIALMLPHLTSDLMGLLFDCVHVFASSSTSELLKRNGTVASAMLALAESGLAFYSRLVPFIVS
jgi:hypothetical protein